MRHLAWLPLLIFAIAISSPFSISESSACPVQEAAPEKKADSADKDAKAEKKKPETIEVKKKTIRVFKTLTGKLESKQHVEVKADFEKWTDLKIKTVAKQGEVAQGTELIAFDTESIDKAIVEAEFSLRNSQFAHKLAELEAKKAEESYALDQEMAEQAWVAAQEDYQYYKDVLVPQREKDIAYDEKTSEYSLEYSKDELDQLTQMYTEDELTEESEAIVLKRAQRSVESAERYRDRSIRRIAKQRKYDIPRTDKREEHSYTKAKMAYEKSQVTLPIAKEKAEIGLAKSAFELEQKVKALKELTDDRQKMIIKSPAAGILFYGENDRGKWTGAYAGVEGLKADKKVAAKSVFMTIVDPTRMMVRSSVEEASLSSFAAGLSGKAMFEAIGTKIVPVAIDSIERIPLSGGKYDCKVNLQGATEAGLLPGMGSKMSFLVHVNNEAMVVPKASVFSDDEGFTHYVYKASDEGEPEKVDVETGKTSGDDIEILSGLSVGDMITKKKP